MLHKQTKREEKSFRQILFRSNNANPSMVLVDDEVKATHRRRNIRKGIREPFECPLRVKSLFLCDKTN